MAILTKQAIYREAGQTPYPFAALTNGSGDRKTYTDTRKPWSSATGFEAVFAPYGLLTGGAITPAASLANNQVDVAALTAMMPAATGASATTGVLTVESSANLAITRGTTNGYRITSVTVTAAGAIAAVAGTESTAFSETRGGAGGPPFIPVDSIEIGQVRLTSTTAAKVLASEIYQVPGLHQELSSSPTYTADYLAGTVVFSDALPAIHTGNVARLVHARVAVPLFAEIANTKDWVPANPSFSAQSTSYYDGDVGGVSSSIGSASFAVSLQDGVTDELVKKQGENLIWKYKPDKNGTAYQLTKGPYSIAQTNPVKSAPTATVTIVAEGATQSFAS